MNAITELASEVRQITEQADKKFRFNRQRMLEDEIAQFRPDYNEALELIDAIVCGLRARFNDDLPIDLEHDFSDLKLALNEADDIECRRGFEPEGYDSIGMDHDNVDYRKD